MGNILFVGEHICPHYNSVQWHDHDYWELVYCTDGEGVFQFENGTTLHYKVGEAVAIPPRQRHTNTSQGGFRNLHMTMDSPDFPQRAAFRVADTEGNLKHAFSQAKYYYLSDIKKRELVLSALGDLIASYMVVYSSNNEFSEPVERIRTTIIRNFTRPDFALDGAVRQLPFHYDYLRKLFKKEMGMTPLEYMTGLRMKKAETMLSAMWAKEWSVAEIAQMCGFEDALYFSRVFKKHFGHSPSHYVKAAHGQESREEKPETSE